MFRTVPLSIIKSFSLYTQQWYMSFRFADSLGAGAYAPAHKLFRFADSLGAGAYAPAHKLSANLYDIYHIVTNFL